MKRKILVTPRSITKGQNHWSLKVLEEAGFQVVYSTPGIQPTDEELLELLPDCVGYLAGVEPVTAKVLGAAKNLKVISRNGVGIDNIDLSAAEQLNIKICRTEGANARGVAELAISLILSLVRSIPYSDTNLTQKRWERRKGIELKEKTIGIIGCGRIGKEVASLALGLNMKVLGYDAFSQSFFTSSNDFKYVGFNELLRESDIISFHCPPKADSTPLIGKDEIAKMKDGVYLANTARAELFDESAILDNLNKGKISGFATDVFRKEPPDDYTLINHEKVIATPHIGGFTLESVDRAMGGAVDNILENI